MCAEAGGSVVRGDCTMNALPALKGPLVLATGWIVTGASAVSERRPAPVAGIARPCSGLAKVFMQSSSKYTRRHHAVVVQRAAHMRAALTSSEAALWLHLRGGQLGVWFRGQVVVGRFVADFAAASVKLVVEVDGTAHVPRAAADARRDRPLARLGWRVVRLPVQVVLQRPLKAIALVRAALTG
jgi:very-short-patch-repair endonuclease